MTEIPQAQWQTFCDEFSRQHRGWRVKVDTVDTQLLDEDPAATETNAEILAHDQVFQGITAEPKTDAVELNVFVGEGSECLTHSVTEPLRLRFEESLGGAHRGLRIDEASGRSTRVRFRVPSAPETLDGLAGSEY